MNPAKDRFFLDTNVLVYSFDDRSKSKQARACDLVEHALSTHRGIISYQVVQEFLNAATRKFSAAIPMAEAQLYLDEFLCLCAKSSLTLGCFRKPYPSRARQACRSMTPSS